MAAAGLDGHFNFRKYRAIFRPHDIFAGCQGELGAYGEFAIDGLASERSRPKDLVGAVSF